jgi:hypothetical protein
MMKRLNLIGIARKWRAWVAVTVASASLLVIACAQDPAMYVYMEVGDSSGDGYYSSWYDRCNGVHVSSWNRGAWVFHGGIHVEQNDWDGFSLVRYTDFLNGDAFGRLAVAFGKMRVIYSGSGASCRLPVDRFGNHWQYYDARIHVFGTWQGSGHVFRTGSYTSSGATGVGVLAVKAPMLGSVSDSGYGINLPVWGNNYIDPSANPLVPISLAGTVQATRPLAHFNRLFGCAEFSIQFNDSFASPHADALRVEARVSVYRNNVLIFSSPSPSLGLVRWDANDGTGPKSASTGGSTSIDLRGDPEGTQYRVELNVKAFHMGYRDNDAVPVGEIQVLERTHSRTFTVKKRADVDGNGCVDDADLLAVLFAFGQTGQNIPEDLTGDGMVDDGDLLRVLFAFGEGCE